MPPLGLDRLTANCYTDVRKLVKTFSDFNYFRDCLVYPLGRSKVSSPLKLLKKTAHIDPLLGTMFCGSDQWRPGTSLSAPVRDARAGRAGRRPKETRRSALAHSDNAGSDVTRRLVSEQ